MKMAYDFVVSPSAQKNRATQSNHEKHIRQTQIKGESTKYQTSRTSVP